MECRRDPPTGMRRAPDCSSCREPCSSRGLNALWIRRFCCCSSKFSLACSSDFVGMYLVEDVQCALLLYSAVAHEVPVAVVRPELTSDRGRVKILLIDFKAVHTPASSPHSRSLGGQGFGAEQFACWPSWADSLGMFHSCPFGSSGFRATLLACCLVWCAPSVS